MTTKRHEGRTGLGMHLVYNLVNRGLGGSIKLKSAPYSGVEYTIVFPADRRAMAEKVNQKNESAEVEEKTEEPSC